METLTRTEIDNIEQRGDLLIGQLVPGMDNCETLEGELLRAAARIKYRYYNDGDYFWEGYGIETAGNAANFLLAHSDKIENLRNRILAAERVYNETYEICINQIVKLVVEYVESRNGGYTPNTDDLWNDAYSHMRSTWDLNEDDEEDEDDEDPYWDDQEDFFDDTTDMSDDGSW